MQIIITQAANSGTPGTLLRAGSSPIDTASATWTVAFTSAVADTDYALAISVHNLTDASPIFLIPIVTAKTVNGFTVTFNAPTDTANYVLEYVTGAYL